MIFIKIEPWLDHVYKAIEHLFSNVLHEILYNLTIVFHSLCEIKYNPSKVNKPLRISNSTPI